VGDVGDRKKLLNKAVFSFCHPPSPTLGCLNLSIYVFIYITLEEGVTVGDRVTERKKALVEECFLSPTCHPPWNRWVTESYPQVCIDK